MLEQTSIVLVGTRRQNRQMWLHFSERGDSVASACWSTVVIVGRHGESRGNNSKRI